MAEVADRDAARCPAAAQALAFTSATCTAEQDAVITSIVVDTSQPSQYNSVTDPGQHLQIKLANGAKRSATVIGPPWVPYPRDCVSDIDYAHQEATYNCDVPIKAHLYQNRVVQLTLPDGQKADTDHQPGRYRLLTWLGALCLLVALWPLLAVGLPRRARQRTSASSQHATA
jgi:hypothetical protein